MSTTQTQNTKDVFSIYTKSFDKIHGAVEKTNPTFLQAFTDLQQEYFSTLNTFAHNTLAANQLVADKIGINANAPETTSNVVSEITEGIIKTIDVQTKVVQTAIDATKQNIKTINEHASSFAELNQNIINSWITAFRPRN